MRETQVVWMKTGYKVSAKLPARPVADFHVAEPFPIMLEIVPRAEVKAAFSVTGLQHHRRAAPFDVEFVEIDGVLMRPILSPDFREGMTPETIAKETDSILDHPFPYDVDWYGLAPTTPNTMKDRSSFAFKSIEIDGRNAALVDFQAKATSLKIVDGVIYKPAPPPCWSVIATGHYEGVSVSLPDIMHSGGALLAPNLDAQAIAEKLGLGRSGDIVPSDTAPECHGQSLVLSLKSVMTSVMSEFSRMPFGRLPTDLCLALARSRKLFDEITVENAQSMMSEALSIAREAAQWPDRPDLMPGTDEYYRMLFGRHMVNLDACAEYLEPREDLEEAIDAAFSP